MSTKQQFKFALLCLCMLFNISPLTASAQTNETSSYLIGAGIYDITGPAAETNMMGFAQLHQDDNGIHMRLRARAFVIVDPQSQKRVVFVSADLGMVFQSVKDGVMEALQQRYQDLYTDENVLISATHTHSGPGGYAHHQLFNMTALGFQKDNYQAIVEGIVHAIENAHNNLEPGKIEINSGELLDANGNRSIAAYLKNPQAERDLYGDDVDKTMTLIKLSNHHGEAIGMINWFPVHPVSMSSSNTLISGDNKGYAAYLFEKDQQTNYLAKKTFVAAFAQAHEGDVTPNIFGQEPDGKCEQFDCGDFKRTKIIGQRQYEAARGLYENAQVPLSGSVDYRLKYIDMPNNNDYATCTAALGYAFGAGTTDGPGPGIFKQGQLSGNVFIDAISQIIIPSDNALEDCHSPKPILLAVGAAKPEPWVPQTMPLQILKVGQLAIVGVPGEFTTMSGRRLEKAMLAALSPDVNTVVIAGLANSYAGYVTTPEEYEQQNYEGGFTVFGQQTLPAYIHGFTEIAKDMQAGRVSDKGVPPAKPKNYKTNFQPPVLFDDVAITKKFGDVYQNAQSSYRSGEVVHVVFRGANPRNTFKTQDSFLEIQRYEGGQWVTVAYDWDWETIFKWQRQGVSYSLIHIYWQIPEDAPAGQYRITHSGQYKNGWDRKLYDYSGQSRTFFVN